MNDIYLPADICERFDISKSTLFRWESEGRIPAPARNLRGERQYTEDDIATIGRVVQLRRHRRRYAQTLAEENQEARPELRRLGEQNALFKFVNFQDTTGLAELREYAPLRSETIRQLLRIALDRYEPTDTQFWKVLDVVWATSAPDDP